MRIIITGGAGFIGSNLILYLHQHYPEMEILNIDKLTYASDVSYLEPLKHSKNYHFKKMDLVDRDAVREAVKNWKPDGVIHLRQNLTWIIPSRGQSRSCFRMWWGHLISWRSAGSSGLMKNIPRKIIDLFTSLRMKCTASWVMRDRSAKQHRMPLIRRIRPQKRAAISWFDHTITPTG